MAVAIDDRPGFGFASDAPGERRFARVFCGTYARHAHRCAIISGKADR
jgi:hypothetical protein